jgi:geranylgeranyl diphosphate synthase type II
MINPTSEEELVRIPPEERILLLPHCLRPSETCPGKYSKQGLLCPDDCYESCSIRILREAAEDLNYKGVCIAPGGALALRYVKQTEPKGVVAVACDKELEMGVNGLECAAQNGEAEMPAVVVIPLLKDGCVDTEVDLELALRTLEIAAEPSSYLRLPYAIPVAA